MDPAEIAGFESGDAELDAFLARDALRLQDQRVVRVYLAVYEDVIGGYVALLADAVVLQTRERTKLCLATEDHPAVADRSTPGCPRKGSEELMRSKTKKPKTRARRTPPTIPTMKISKRLAAAMTKLRKAEERARKAEKESKKDSARVDRLLRRWAREG